MGSAALYTSERRDPRCFDLPFGNRLRSSTMHISDDFHMLRERVQTIVRQRRRKEKRSLDIVSQCTFQGSRLVPELTFYLQSAPFNFEKNPVNLPGVSDEQ